MTRPRILHVIETLGMGGAQRRLFNDLRHLGDRFTHRVCTLFPETDDFGKELLALDVPVTCLGLARLRDIPRGVARLAALLGRERDIDLVHSQLFAADVVARLAGRLRGRPVLSTTQSAVYEPDSGLDSTKRRTVDRATARLVTRFIAVSDFVRLSLHRRLGVPLERIEVLPNTVDVQRVMPDAERRRRVRLELRLDHDEFAWITVGRLNAPKGHGYLLAAMRAVCAQRPATRLLVVGSGAEEARLRATAEREGLGARVAFLGDRGDVTDLLDASDGFVFPSLSEGLPLAVLEAMAMEKPCVASRIAPHAEIIVDGDSGLLVPPREATPLAGAMLAVQTDEARARALAQSGRVRVATRYDAAAGARRLGDLYERVLAVRGAR